VQFAVHRAPPGYPAEQFLDFVVGEFACSHVCLRGSAAKRLEGVRNGRHKHYESGAARAPQVLVREGNRIRNLFAQNVIQLFFVCEDIQSPSQDAKEQEK